MLETARSLARRRAVRVAAAALVVAGLAAGGLPLLEVPGFELAELGALLSALVLSPWLGLAAARLELARPAPARPSPWAAWGAAAAVSAALLLALLAGAAARAMGGPCDPFLSVGFFPALALPSALLGTALAVALGFAARGRTGRAAAGYALVVLLALAGRAAEAWWGPAASALDPLLGYWPGPLYDEGVPLDAPLLAARAAAVGWALAWAGAAAALQGAGAARRRAALLALMGLCAGALLSLPARALPGQDRRAALAAALGGLREGPRCTVHFPAEKPDAAADALLAECEFHVADVAARLGIASPPRVTVWVHRSAAEKRTWVGASDTDYAKPWLHELHLRDAPVPHPVLRHEVVHAVAAALPPGPLHVPARARVWPAMVLVEGLAVALETPRGAWTVHEWSRTARDLGYLPDLTRALGPTGFWSVAPARAYTAAGSFLAWALQRYGPGPVAEAYRTGDLAGALGRPLPALVAEWQAFLDGVPAPEALRATARARLSRASLFERRCVREAAAVGAAAAAAAGAGRTAEACALYDREAALTGSPWAVKARGDVLARAGDAAGARAAWAEAQALAGDEPSASGALATAEGDLAWRAGDREAAAAAWRRAQAQGPDRPDARALEARLAAAADPALEPAARDYLLGGGELALARVARLDRPLPAYLLGRALAARGERAAAAAELARAVAGPLPPALAVEARLLLAETRCPAEGPDLAGAAFTAGDRARLDAAARRCAFEAAGR
ncbi:MAG: type VI secretion system protein [Anaeromyxobacter sp.]